MKVQSNDKIDDVALKKIWIERLPNRPVILIVNGDTAQMTPQAYKMLYIKKISNVSAVQVSNPLQADKEIDSIKAGNSGVFKVNQQN